MSELELSLYIIITITLLFNLRNLFKEARKIKAAGKTPLVAKNVITTFMAALGEAFIVWGIFTLYSRYNVLETGYTASVVVFIVAYLLRNIGSYGMAWLTWAIFIKTDKKKMIDKIEEEQKGV
jgi:succinate-acetate transporter protein